MHPQKLYCVAVAGTEGALIQSQFDEQSVK